MGDFAHSPVAVQYEVSRPNLPPPDRITFGCPVSSRYSLAWRADRRALMSARISIGKWKQARKNA